MNIMSTIFQDVQKRNNQRLLYKIIGTFKNTSLGMLKILSQREQYNIINGYRLRGALAQSFC